MVGLWKKSERCVLIRNLVELKADLVVFIVMVPGGGGKPRSFACMTGCKIAY